MHTVIFVDIVPFLLLHVMHNLTVYTKFDAIKIKKNRYGTNSVSVEERLSESWKAIENEFYVYITMIFMH